MQNIREFNHKFIEVSHIKIGLKLFKLWNFEVMFWVPILKGHRKYGKTQHENGLKFLTSIQTQILMQNIREFNHKFMKVSHVLIGIR